MKLWAWDPVENSSIIPWLVSIVMVHTMLVQKRGGGLGSDQFASRLRSVRPRSLFDIPDSEWCAR